MTTQTKALLGIGSLILLGMTLFDSNEPRERSSYVAESPAPSRYEIEEYEPEVVEMPEQRNCHPSYSGCLKPDASDYDCAGGSGNGPYYTGAVRVTGPDVFGLDRDGDGWGCE